MVDHADRGGSDGRLRWRSRRGMLELELALAPFVETRLEVLSEHQKLVYEKLLEHDDWDIFEWIQGRGEPDDPDLAAILGEVRAARVA